MSSEPRIQTIVLAGEPYVLMPASDYEQLCGRAGEQIQLTDDALPPFPKPEKDGRFPALEYTCVAIARDIVRQRKAAGLTQTELARLSGVRQETLSRIESGRYRASTKTIDKLDAELQLAIKKRIGKRR